MEILQKEITDYENSIKEMKEDFPEIHSISMQSKKKQIIQHHREGSNSLWRRIQSMDSCDQTSWFSEVEELSAIRFEQEKPLRSVIKRMAVVDENITILTNPQ